MNNNKLKISIVLNILIVLLVLFATLIMFSGFRFMYGSEPVLESTRFGVFRFFTVDSNVFMGIVALAFVIEEVKLVKRKIYDLSRNMYILKLMSTTSVTITFLTVFLYLGPISDGGIVSMIQNSNLFFHLIIPVISIITFIFFEKTDKLNLKDSSFGLIPTGLYAVFYLINIVVHMENGKVSPLYDWYWFVQNGVWTAVIVAPFMLLFTYLVSLILLKISILD